MLCVPFLGLFEVAFTIYFELFYFYPGQVVAKDFKINRIAGLSFKEAESVFKSNLNPPPPEDLLQEFARNAIMPQSDASCQAVLWMRHYFTTFGKMIYVFNSIFHFLISHMR